MPTCCGAGCVFLVFEGGVLLFDGQLSDDRNTAAAGALDVCTDDNTTKILRLHFGVDQVDFSRSRGRPCTVVVCTWRIRCVREPNVLTSFAGSATIWR